MALRLEVRLDPSKHRAMLAALGDDVAVATLRALKRTGDSTRTHAERLLADDTGLRKKDVARALRLEPPTVRHLVATLHVSGARLPLLAFGARQTRRGVTYRLPTGRGTAPSAFIARMRSGHEGVFRRRAAAGPLRARRRGARAAAAGFLMVPRLPIDELRGPSLPQVFMKETINRALVVHAETTFDKNLAHESAFLLRAS